MRISADWYYAQTGWVNFTFGNWVKGDAHGPVAWGFLLLCAFTVATIIYPFAAAHLGKSAA